MSLLKFIKAQFGMSSTPANNFTLDASAQDGTMKLSRGNAGATTQDIMTVDSAGKVTFPGGSQMLGVGQEWVNVKALRSLNTQYTNDTGKPIQASIHIASTLASWICTCYVGGVRVGYWQSDNANALHNTMTLTIPAGHTYKVEVVNCVLGDWVELR